MFIFYSGVSVNVQDLAPSCAGALFGKSENTFPDTAKVILSGCSFDEDSRLFHFYRCDEYVRRLLR